MTKKPKGKRLRVKTEWKRYGLWFLCGFEGTWPRKGKYHQKMVLDSSMVEHSAVNRRVVGSSPTRGVKHQMSAVRRGAVMRCFFFKKKRRLHGQAVKTPPFHGGNRGSNPLGVITKRLTKSKCFVRIYKVAVLRMRINKTVAAYTKIKYGAVAKW